MIVFKHSFIMCIFLLASSCMDAIRQYALLENQQRNLLSFPSHAAVAQAYGRAFADRLEQGIEEAPPQATALIPPPHSKTPFELTHRIIYPHWRTAFCGNSSPLIPNYVAESTVWRRKYNVYWPHYSGKYTVMVGIKKVIIDNDGTICELAFDSDVRGIFVRFATSRWKSDLNVEHYARVYVKLRAEETARYRYVDLIVAKIGGKKSVKRGEIHRAAA